jgi:uncharacterized RDD family membrane protein YckC/pSer/pThr/pTyr-binding forkhead associated (FHA) protein
MTAQIRITYSDGRIEDRTLPPGSYLAGREQGDIVLRDPNTSGRHAQIDVQFGRVTMTDLGSTNGTYDLQGQRLSGPYVMLPNQAIRLGTTTIMLMPPQMTAAGTQVMPQMPGVPSIGGPSPNTAPYAQPQQSYGQPSGAPYGQPPAGAPYGQPPGNSFGQAPSAPHGQPPGAPYGQPPAGASFGQAPSAPYGQPPGAPYGQPPPGQPQPGGSFGQPPGAPYGQPPHGQPQFGQPPGAPYGQSPQNPYQSPGAAVAGAIAGAGFSPGGEALWGARAVGFIIDSVIVGGIMMVVMVAFTLISGLVAGAAGTVAAAGAPDEAMGVFFSQYLAMMLIMPVLGIALVGYNGVYLVSKRGYSIGQGVMKLKVVNASGALLPFGTAALRVLARIGISVVPFGGFVDLLWPLWDQHRQTIHDKVSGAFVFPDQARQ